MSKVAINWSHINSVNILGRVVQVVCILWIDIKLEENMGISVDFWNKVRILIRKPDWRPGSWKSMGFQRWRNRSRGLRGLIGLYSRSDEMFTLWKLSRFHRNIQRLKQNLFEGGKTIAVVYPFVRCYCICSIF